MEVKMWLMKIAVYDFLSLIAGTNGNFMSLMLWSVKYVRNTKNLKSQLIRYIFERSEATFQKHNLWIVSPLY